MTILSAQSITLEGAVLDIGVNARVSGSIAAPFGDATANAGMDFVNVSGLTVTSDIPTNDDAVVTIDGIYTGSITVTAGTVTVGDDDVTVTANATLTVSSGATLSVPSGAVLNTYINSSELVDNPVVIDGTIVVRNASGLSGAGEVLVNGTMDIRNFTLTTDVRVTGTLAVEDGYTLTIANGGKVLLGEKPDTLGATGSITGTVNITAGTNGAIVAYAGTDLSGAAIMVNAATGESDAAATTYNINGVPYMTVYTYQNEYTVGEGAVIDGNIELTGYDSNSFWYASEDYTTNDDSVNGVNIGVYDNVYTNFKASYVYGTISEGTGLTIYIDGLTLENFLDYYGEYAYRLTVGTHVVSIAANAQYDASNATITFNNQTVQNGGTITVTADMDSFTLAASGAVPAEVSGGSSTTGDDGLGLTDYLLIILVILIVVMAIMVALRLMRS